MKDLIELYTGPEFMIDLRYAQVLNVTFVCMMYSSGMPILYILTSFTLLFLFWVDKFWLFMFYKKP
jgi:hypothetical protein